MRGVSRRLWTCDKCGETTNEPTEAVRPSLWSSVDVTRANLTNQSLDLCHDCTRHLLDHSWVLDGEA